MKSERYNGFKITFTRNRNNVLWCQAIDSDGKIVSSFVCDTKKQGLRDVKSFLRKK